MSFIHTDMSKIENIETQKRRANRFLEQIKEENNIYFYYRMNNEPEYMHYNEAQQISLLKEETEKFITTKGLNKKFRIISILMDSCEKAKCINKTVIDDIKISYYKIPIFSYEDDEQKEKSILGFRKLLKSENLYLHHLFIKFSRLAFGLINKIKAKIIKLTTAST